MIKFLQRRSLSVLLRVTVCYRVLPHVTPCYPMLPRVTACYPVVLPRVTSCVTACYRQRTLKRVRHSLNSVPSARPGHPEGDKLVREVHLTCELMVTAARSVTDGHCRQVSH